MSIFELKQENFHQAMAETPFRNLPTVFAGTWDECKVWAEQSGYRWRPNENMLFNGYWWNKTEEVSLYPL